MSSEKLILKVKISFFAKIQVSRRHISSLDDERNICPGVHKNAKTLFVVEMENNVRLYKEFRAGSFLIICKALGIDHMGWNFEILARYVIAEICKHFWIN